MDRFTLELHRHGRTGRPLELSDRIVSKKFVKSLFEPWAGVQAVLTATPFEASHLIMGGDWYVLRNALGLPFTWGRVRSNRTGFTTKQDGADTSKGLNFTGQSWFAFLHSKVNLFSVTGLTKTIGTLYAMEDWPKIVADCLINPVSQGQAGYALEKFFALTCNIRLPETLGGELLSEAIRVVHDTASAEAFAPNRLGQDGWDTLSGGVGAPAQFSSMFNAYRGTYGEVMRSSFVPDPAMVELFPSDERGGYAEPSALARILGVRPSLLYRWKPFRAKKLSDVAVGRISAPPIELELALELASEDIHAWSHSQLKWWDPQKHNNEAAERATEQVKSVRRAAGEVSIVTAGLHNKITWEPSRGIRLPVTIVRDFDVEWSDDERLNAATMSIDITGESGPNALEQYGLPIRFDEEIERHGLRMAQPPWNMRIPGRTEGQTGVTVQAYLRSHCASYMQFHGANHLLGSGTLMIDFTEALASQQLSGGDPSILDVIYDVQVGEPFAIKMDGRYPDFVGYVEEIAHSYTRDASSGTETADTTIKFSRGRFEPHEEALTSFFIPINQPAGVQPARSAAPSTGESRVPTITAGTGAALSTNAEKSNHMLVGGELVAVPFAVTRHMLIPSAGMKAAYRSYRDGPLLNAVVHYTAGNPRATPDSVRGLFQRAYARGTGLKSTHFIIDTDGSVMQIVDAKTISIHTAGFNDLTVGIDLICPYNCNALGQYVADPPHIPPFDYVSGWKIYNANGGLETTIAARNVANATQRWAAKALLVQLNVHVGVELRHDAGTAEANAVRRFTASEKRAALAAGGVWHHMQFNENRADSIGTDLYELV